jgi:hypothetical protein
VLLAACSSPKSLGEDGFETGPCVQGACLGDLVCLSNLCVVAPDAAPATDTGSVATTEPASTSEASSSGGVACTPEQTDCDGTCVDLMTDPTNCGACGDALPAGQQCVAGEGACDSPALEPCPDGCADLATDPDNCTGCGYVCPSLEEGIDPMPVQCGEHAVPAGGTAPGCLGTITVDVRASCTDICGAAGWACEVGAGFYSGSGCTNESLFQCLEVPPPTNDAQGCLGDFTEIVCQCWLTAPSP